jgi:hypothetical protein
MNIYDKPYDHRDMEWRLNHFRNIADTGIHIVLYICRDYETILHDFFKQYENIILIVFANGVRDTYAYRIYETESPTLPIKRHEKKDTENYIALMNAKVEFLYDTIQKNHWKSTHFAWIDFNITHVCKDIPSSTVYLKWLSDQTLSSSFLAIPGCMEPIYIDIIHCVWWRFCGGFFIGDMNSIIDFYKLYREHFPFYVQKTGTFLWEVNFWAWLERHTNWNPDWFQADHDDSIIHIPDCFIVKNHYNNDAT